MHILCLKMLRNWIRYYLPFSNVYSTIYAGHSCIVHERSKTKQHHVISSQIESEIINIPELHFVSLYNHNFPTKSLSLSLKSIYIYFCISRKIAIKIISLCPFFYYCFCNTHSLCINFSDCFHWSTASHCMNMWPLIYPFFWC